MPEAGAASGRSSLRWIQRKIQHELRSPEAGAASGCPMATCPMGQLEASASGCRFSASGCRVFGFWAQHKRVERDKRDNRAETRSTLGVEFLPTRSRGKGFLSDQKPREAISSLTRSWATPEICMLTLPPTSDLQSESDSLSDSTCNQKPGSSSPEAKASDGIVVHDVID